jgi:hypothetical protein
MKRELVGAKREASVNSAYLIYEWKDHTESNWFGATQEAQYKYLKLG